MEIPLTKGTRIKYCGWRLGVGPVQIVNFNEGSSDTLSVFDWNL